MNQGYVDIHSHILPQTDDGAQSSEETVAMLELAYKEGIRTIIATPHYGRRNPDYDAVRSERIVELINEYIRKRNASAGDLSGLKVVLGNELTYHSDIAADLRSGKARTLAGSQYALVEFYDNTDFATMIACAREMNIYGYKAIYAHVERYIALRDDPDKIKTLRDEGVLMQVNADSLTEVPVEAVSSGGENGAPRRKIFTWMRNTVVGGSMGIRDSKTLRTEAAWKLLLAGNVDFIASDAHGDIFRRPLMEKAFATVRQVAGEETAERIAENARFI